LETVVPRAYGEAVEGPSIFERGTVMWGVFLAGLVVGFVGVYLVAAQPLMSQIESLENRVTAMTSDMDALVGMRDQAWETNNLLAGLVSQQKQILEARNTLKEIRALRQEIQVESQRCGELSAALADIARVHDIIIDQRPVTSVATSALSDLAAVQRRLIDEHSGTASAIQALDGLAQTKTAVNELLSVKNTIINQSRDIPAARSAVNDLAAMKSRIVSEANSVAAAQSEFNKFVQLRDRVVDSGRDIEPAMAALDGLMKMKTELLNATPDVADALQNLELFNDFQQEFGDRVKALVAMRSSLMEIVLLETTVQKVARILEPLIQIGNVRRLNDAELRDAARVILEKRGERYGDKRSNEMMSRKDDPFSAELPAEPGPEPVPLPVD
jgi:archaellum component FlaC